MANIRCKACGTAYRYEKEGCCPNCGAYNRPPKRERVNADGTVQHMTDYAYERRNGDVGKVCFEEKECHEEKVCYEDQVRQSNRRGPAPKPTGAVPHSKFPQTQSAPVQHARPVQNKSNPAGCLVTFVVVGFLMAAVYTIATMVLSTLGG